MRTDHCFEIVFKTVMQCQIIDDVIDWKKDERLGLPSFVTATHSQEQSLAMTRQAAAGYADTKRRARMEEALPFEIGLRIVSVCARLTIAAARRRPTRSHGCRHREAKQRRVTTGK